MKSFFSWFKNGIKIKRWIIMILLGVFAIAYALSKVLVLDILNAEEIFFMILLVIIGVSVVIVGIIGIQKRTLEIFIEANGVNQKNLKEKDIQIESLIFNKTIYKNGPKVVVLGGGAGLDRVISGLKAYTDNIVAISLLSEEKDSNMQNLMYKDIKDSIASLARDSSLMNSLLDWNYQGEDLKGHNFGDIYIRAVQEMTGTVSGGLDRTKDILNMVGEVAPTSLDDTVVCVELIDGTIIEGKEKVPEVTEKEGKEINRSYLSPANLRPNPRAIKAIEEADIIVFAPGRLYTNVIPNLLVKDIASTIRNTKAPRVYIANIMTEAGETKNYKLSDHIRAIFDHSGGKVFDHCICDTGYIIPEFVRLYHKKGAETVDIDTENIKEYGIKFIKKDLSKVENEKIIHDSDTIALAIMEIVFTDLKYSEQQNDTQYALLKDVIKKQKKIEKRKEKNLNKIRRKEKGKYRESKVKKTRTKTTDRAKGRHSGGPKYKESQNRLLQNLDKIHSRFERKELKNKNQMESKFSEKYKSRIESVRNADKQREENIKRLQEDQEKLKKEREKAKAKSDIVKRIVAKTEEEEKKTIKKASGTAKEE